MIAVMAVASDSLPSRATIAAALPLSTRQRIHQRTKISNPRSTTIAELTAYAHSGVSMGTALSDHARGIWVSQAVINPFSSSIPSRLYPSRNCRLNLYPGLAYLLVVLGAVWPLLRADPPMMVVLAVLWPLWSLFEQIPALL